MATVRLRDIRKSFGGVEVIKGVDLDIADRELAVVVGPSGCGKSTLLRLVAGLEEISSGDLWIDGVRVNDVPPAKRGLAMVFQSYALYPHMSVADNLGFSLRLAGVPKETRLLKVREAARILQIEPLLGRKPKELSGGERQRVAIGRAIVRNPKVFLFDEPLSNLDAALRVQMRFEIMRLHEELRATMLYVTHDQVEAMTMADVIVVLNGGLIEQVGTPLDLYHHPRNLFVAGFIGSPRMNFVPATVMRVGGGGVSVTLAGGATIEVPAASDRLRPGESVTLGARPEHLSLGGAGSFQGEALVVERLGSATFVHVAVEGGAMLTVQAGDDHPVRLHDRVSVKVNGETAHLFDAAGLTVAAIKGNRQEKNK
ncbi:MAG: ABC transporter [Candidatus Aminicenantes bacterium RBG_16_63_16]|nr:MAG: ABC transporter [Candidatus Aminicenantes bacterium RBG_16_63_16]